MKLFRWLYRVMTGERIGTARVRRRYLEDNPECAVCGERWACKAHEIKPTGEPDCTNYLTLCPDHLWLIGKLMHADCYNPTAAEDAAYWRDKIRYRQRRPT